MDILGKQSGDHAEPSVGWEPLIERIAAGDRVALSRLYDESHRLVYGLALRIVRDPSAAEDVAVETFARIWRSAGTFDRKRGSGVGWMCRLARNCSIDRLRAESRHVSGRVDEIPEIPASGEDPEQSAALRQRRQVVRRSLASLGPQQREAIELAYFEGLTHSEIAARLGEPLGTIKARLRRGMLKLRGQLQPMVQ